MPKFRKIPLKEIEAEEHTDPTQGPAVGAFNYGTNLLYILRVDPKGMSADEVLKALEVEEEVRDARDKGADHFLLTEDQWSVLKSRVDSWRYPHGGPAVAGFIRDVRDAERVDFNAAPDPSEG